MTEIYRITIRGRVLESRDLKKLLARAVREKRNMDRKFLAIESGHGNAGHLGPVTGRPEELLEGAERETIPGGYGEGAETADVSNYEKRIM